MVPGEYLSFLSVDKWTIIFNLLNTFILYKIIKKFLFKPVNKIIAMRKAEIEKDYSDAELTKAQARSLKNSYEQKINLAKQEAEQIIKTATMVASQQSDGIIKTAKQESNNIIKRANEEIELQRKKLLHELKDETIDIAIIAASEIIKKDISAEDHKELIDKLFSEVGVQ